MLINLVTGTSRRLRGNISKERFISSDSGIAIYTSVILIQSVVTQRDVALIIRVLSSSPPGPWPGLLPMSQRGTC